MNLPKFESPNSLYGEELNFLKVNAKKINLTVKKHITENPTYLTNIELEISAFLKRVKRSSNKAYILNLYNNFVSNLGLNPKSEQELLELTFEKMPKKLFSQDVIVNKYVEYIIKKWGKNGGENKAMQVINDMYQQKVGTERVKYLQEFFNLEPTGLIDFDTLINIVNFQNQNKLAVDGLAWNGGETMNLIDSKVNLLNSIKQGSEGETKQIQGEVEQGSEGETKQIQGEVEQGSEGETQNFENYSESELNGADSSDKLFIQSEYEKFQKSLPRYDSLSSLYGNEIKFLQDNSNLEKPNIYLLQYIKENPDYLIKIEKEIGSFLLRSKNILNIDFIKSLYVDFMKVIGIEPKSDKELIDLVSKINTELLYDENIDVNNRIKHIIKKWGRNGGVERALDTIGNMYNSKFSQDVLFQIQEFFGLEKTEKITISFLVSIVKFQLENGLYPDGLAFPNGKTLNLINTKINKPIETKLETDDINDGSDSLIENNDIDELVLGVLTNNKKVEVNDAISNLNNWHQKNLGKNGIKTLQYLLMLEPSGTVDLETAGKIVLFQKENNLKLVDARVMKNGETWKCLVENFSQRLYNKVLSKVDDPELSVKIQSVDNKFLFDVLTNGTGNIDSDIFDNEGKILDSIIIYLKDYFNDFGMSMDVKDLNSMSIGDLFREKIDSKDFLMDNFLVKGFDGYFKVDFKGHRNAENSFSLGNILPVGIKKVQVLNSDGKTIIGTRISLEGDFYDDKGNKIVIYSGYKVKILEKQDENQLQTIGVENEKMVNDFLQSDYIKNLNFSSQENEQLKTILDIAINHGVKLDFIVSYWLMTGKKSLGFLNYELDTFEIQIARFSMIYQESLMNFKDQYDGPYTGDSKINSPEFVCHYLNVRTSRDHINKTDYLNFMKIYTKLGGLNFTDSEMDKAYLNYSKSDFAKKTFSQKVGIDKSELGTKIDDLEYAQAKGFSPMKYTPDQYYTSDQGSCFNQYKSIIIYVINIKFLNKGFCIYL